VIFDDRELDRILAHQGWPVTKPARAPPACATDEDEADLAEAVCRLKNWRLIQTRFYTGIPDIRDNASWHHFWEAKLLSMSRSGVHVFSRKLRYRNKAMALPKKPEFGEMAGKEYSFLAGEEKGIDVRISLDFSNPG
jgi:hypothetical protein